MRKPRTAESLADLRRLAIKRVKDGFSQREVARFLDVADRSVRRWVAIERSSGSAALCARPRSGRPRKLTEEQATQTLLWLKDSPCTHGFATDRWTAPRVTELIRRHFSVLMNHRYINEWLRCRGITPQIPARVARERDESEIQRWLKNIWPWIKKKPAMTAQTSYLPMKAAF